MSGSPGAGEGWRLGDIAKALSAELRGDPDCRVVGLATLAAAGEGDLSFLSSGRYRRDLHATRAAAVILSAQDAAETDSNLLVCANPRLAYAQASTLLFPPPAAVPGIHASAVVDADARVAATAQVGANTVVEGGAEIGEGCVIGAGCHVGAGSVVGAGTRLMPTVTVLAGVRIGRDCLLHSGVVIGADGFGFAEDRGHWVKIQQIGGVIVGDRVEIGANTTVDRGALDDTVIEDGVIIDNLIQIAHNVHIGENTAIASSTAIAGSTRIGRDCRIAGCVAIDGHLSIADGVVITGASVVTKSLDESGVYSSGTPLQPNRQWHKNNARYKRLDEIARRLEAVERQLAGQQRSGEDG